MPDYGNAIETDSVGRIYKLRGVKKGEAGICPRSALRVPTDWR